MENTTAAHHQGSHIYTTKAYQSDAFLHIESIVVQILYILIGLVAVCFNSWMIAVYWRHRKVRRHISFMMLQLFLFCLCHGIATGVLRVTHRIFLHKLPIYWCMISNLIIEFFDHYTLVLISMLAVERYVLVSNPYFSRKKMAIGSKIAVIISVFAVGVLCLLPMVPELNVPRTPFILSQNPKVAQQENEYHFAINCRNHLNRENIASPIITFALGVISVGTLITVYVRLYDIVKSRISRFSAMTLQRRSKLRKAARCVMCVAFVFMISILPYGIFLELQTLCNVYHLEHSTCFLISSTLLDSFSILATMSSFLAPGCFAVLNPHIRKKILLLFNYECSTLERTDTFTTTSNNHHSTAPSTAMKYAYTNDTMDKEYNFPRISIASSTTLSI